MENELGTNLVGNVALKEEEEVEMKGYVSWKGAANELQLMNQKVLIDGQEVILFVYQSTGKMNSHLFCYNLNVTYSCLNIH